jgi:S-formylglutathione hydrolase FrmB
MRYCVAARSLRGKVAIEVPDFDISKTYEKNRFKNLAAVRTEMKRLLVATIQKRMNDRKQVPLPTATPYELNEANKSWGRRYKAKWVRLSFYISMKVTLYVAWMNSGLTEKELTAKSGLSRTSIRKAWDLASSMNLITVQSVLDALGMVAEIQLLKIKK